MIANLALAVVSRIAGTLTGRPVSGKWLARYFLARSGTHALPLTLESQILALAKDQTVFEFCNCDIESGQYDSDCPLCNGTGDVLPLEPFTVCPDRGTDLYTCVGTFSVQWQEDGSLRYWDTYDWHGNLGWEFDIKLGCLPFSIEIRGSDGWFDKVGKEFLTAGTIAPNAPTATSFDTVGGIRLSRLASKTRLWLWRLFHKRENLIEDDDTEYVSSKVLAKLKDMTFND